jgi:hypothetical protein
MYHHTLAGLLFGVSFFGVYLDAALHLKTSSALHLKNASDHNKTYTTGGMEYQFTDTLGVIFSVLGLILFATVNIRAISGRGDEESFGMLGGGDDDPRAALKHQFLFFVSAFFQLTGFALTVWRLVYWSNDSRGHPWAGWGQMIQTVLAMFAAAFLVYGNYKAHSQSDD